MPEQYPASPRPPRSLPRTKPYSPEEAGQALNVSADTIARHYEALGGFRVGKLVRIPAVRVHELVGQAEDDLTPLDRARSQLPLLKRTELLLIAQEALAAEKVQREERYGLPSATPPR